MSSIEISSMDNASMVTSFWCCHRYYMLKSIILLLLFIKIVCGHIIILNLELDGPCFTKENLTGICKRSRDCAIDYALVRPNICSFDGTSPIVCCSMSPKIASSFGSVERISSSKCDDFKNLLPQSGQHMLSKRSVEHEKELQHILTKRKTYDNQPEVVNGISVDELSECPHMSRIGFNASTGIEFFCGGSLISEKFVLSAAHCRSAGAGKDADTVRLGYSEDYEIETFAVHPSYSSASKHNDIALISLVGPVTIGPTAFPVCLTQTDVEDGLSVTIFGYGRTSFYGDTSEELMKVDLQTIKNENCQEEYDSVTDIVASQVCAHDPKNSGKDACLGDSGGPMQKGNKLVGVTSYGILCGTSVPGVYTKVSAYLDWIENIVWA